jgi:hypothetical protein
MSDDVHYICEMCRDPINPDTPDTVHAVEVKRLDAMTTTHYVDGLAVLFHEDCYPEGAPNYRRKQNAT